MYLTLFAFLSTCLSAATDPAPPTGADTGDAKKIQGTWVVSPDTFAGVTDEARVYLSESGLTPLMGIAVFERSSCNRLWPLAVSSTKTAAGRHSLFSSIALRLSSTNSILPRQASTR